MEDKALKIVIHNRITSAVRLKEKKAGGIVKQTGLSKLSLPEKLLNPLVGNPLLNINRIFHGGWGGGVLGFIFAGYVPLASQIPYPIIVFFSGHIIDPILATL